MDFAFDLSLDWARLSGRDQKHANRNAVEPSSPIAVCNRGLGGGHHRWIGALVQLGSGFSPPV
jgi:hypothetical protein